MDPTQIEGEIRVFLLDISSSLNDLTPPNFSVESYLRATSIRKMISRDLELQEVIIALKSSKLALFTPL